MNLFPTIDFFHLFILQLSFGLIDLLLLARLYQRVYGPPGIHKAKLYALSVVLGIVTAIGWRFLLEYYRPTSIPPATVLSSFLLLFFFPGQVRKKKVLFSLALFAIACFWTVAYDFIVTPLAHKNAWLIEILVHMGFWLILALVAYIGRKKRNVVPASMWWLLLSFSIVSLALFFGMFFHHFTREDQPYAYPIEIAIMLGLLFLNIVLFILFDRFAAFMEVDRERHLLAQQLQLQNKHYRQLEQFQGQIRTLHHDMRNYLHTITLMASQGEMDDLNQYLQGDFGKIINDEQFIVTGNPALDTILNLKIGELKKAEISVETDIHLPPNLKFTFEQFTAILGNLLDNALDACEKLPMQERWVCIALSYVNGSLLIRISNAAGQKVNAWKNGLPKTTKADKSSHGLGLKSVRQQVEPNGSLHIESKEGSFSVEIVLYHQ